MTYSQELASCFIVFLAFWCMYWVMSVVPQRGAAIRVEQLKQFISPIYTEPEDKDEK